MQFHGSISSFRIGWLQFFFFFFFFFHPQLWTDERVALPSSNRAQLTQHPRPLLYHIVFVNLPSMVFVGLLCGPEPVFSFVQKTQDDTRHCLGIAAIRLVIDP
jgi:hypothetical protein